MTKFQLSKDVYGLIAFQNKVLDRQETPVGLLHKEVAKSIITRAPLNHKTNITQPFKILILFRMEESKKSPFLPVSPL